MQQRQRQSRLLCAPAVGAAGARGTAPCGGGGVYVCWIAGPAAARVGVWVPRPASTPCGSWGAARIRRVHAHGPGWVAAVCDGGGVCVLLACARPAPLVCRYGAGCAWCVAGLEAAVARSLGRLLCPAPSASCCLWWCGKGFCVRACKGTACRVCGAVLCGVCWRRGRQAASAPCTMMRGAGRSASLQEVMPALQPATAMHSRYSEDGIVDGHGHRCCVLFLRCLFAFLVVSRRLQACVAAGRLAAPRRGCARARALQGAVPAAACGAPAARPSSACTPFVVVHLRAWLARGRRCARRSCPGDAGVVGVWQYLTACSG